ncbi:2-dehydropantoate 2-reductase [Streptomyces sp. B5E4]|uniref:ketopantoate reductase family protein n=1 Tax=Streptomyces sp. B5E4 TaxID=3153568 RepID=UPI00325DFB13
MNAAVLGPGGVGGLLAGLLARAGHRVTCVAGAATAGTLQADGITVNSRQFGDFATHVAGDTELRAPVDLCIVAVKATAFDAALERVPPAALGDALVVPLLNGVDHMAALRGRYRPEQVAAGTITVESTRVAPGLIEHGSPFTRLSLASATAPRERLEAAARVLTDAGAEVQVRDDEPSVLWTKMAFLAPMALLTTRHGLPVGGVRTEHRDEMLALLAETAAVASAGGAQVDAEAVASMYDAFPARTKSSMLRDAEAGRPLELDAIGGALLRAARSHGIAVPVAERLVAEIGARAGA